MAALVLTGIVLGLPLALIALLWVSDIGVDFMERMERARANTPTLFDHERP